MDVPGQHAHLQDLDDVRMPGQPAHSALLSDEAFAVGTLDTLENFDRDCAIQ